jgi:hypothetical protein
MRTPGCGPRCRCSCRGPDWHEGRLAVVAARPDQAWPAGKCPAGNPPSPGTPVRCRDEPPVRSAGRCPRAPQRGCSSMAERQLPKLIVRVRFSSPAPQLESAAQTACLPRSDSPGEEARLRRRARCVPDRRCQAATRAATPMPETRRTPTLVTRSAGSVSRSGMHRSGMHLWTYPHTHHPHCVLPACPATAMGATILGTHQGRMLWRPGRATSPSTATMC